MMNLKSDVLYQVAEAIPEGEEMHWLAAGMLEVMQADNGVGLAAPQVGESLRLIIGGHYQLGWSFVIINPVLAKASVQKFPSMEGCLSFPGKQVKVYRHKLVTITGFDLDWNPVKIKARTLMGAVLQHEIDHLDGICLVGEGQ